MKPTTIGSRKEARTRRDSSRMQQARPLSALRVALLLLIAICAITQPALAAWPLSLDDSLELCRCAPLLLGAITSPPALASSVLSRAAQRLLHRSVEGVGSLAGMHASCAMGTRSALARASSGNVATKTSPTRIIESALVTTLSRELIASANPTAAHVAADEAQPGFHRQLRTTLRVEAKPLARAADAAAASPGSANLAARLSSCDLLVLESLPSSFYFDLYQLHEVWRFRSQQQLQQQPQQSQAVTTADATSASQSSSAAAAAYPAMRALSWEDIDVEASTEASPPHLVWLLVDAPQWTTEPAMAGSDSTDAASLTLQLPIHARYQAARRGCADTDSGCLRSAVMEAPRFWLRCPAEAMIAPAVATPAADASSAAADDTAAASSSSAATSSSGQGEWLRLEVAPEAASTTVQMTVPIADLNQLPLVRAVTFAVSMGSAVALCVLVCWTACRAPSQTEPTQRKQD